MKLRDVAIGVVAGFAAAIIIKEISDKAVPYKSADEVLANVKAQFKKEAPIDGSWVYMKPEQFDNGYAVIPVYRGGISRTSNDESFTYEFVADAHQGILLEVSKV